MEKYSKILRQAGFSYGSLILTIIFSPILIFILTRNLTVAEYGVYSLLSITVIMLVFIVELGLSQYIITKLSGAAYKNKIKSFFSLYFFDILFVLAVLFLLIVPLQEFILLKLKLLNYKFEFQIALAIVFFEALFRLYWAYFNSEKRIELNSLLNFLQKNLWVLFLISFFLITRSLSIKNTMLLWLFGAIGTSSVCFLYVKKDFLNYFKIKKMDWGAVKNGVLFGAPLIFTNVGSWILIAADRYILNYYLTTSIVGIYSLGYSLVTLILTVGTIIPVVLYPYVAEAFNKKKDHNLLFNISIKYGLMLVVPMIVGLFVLNRQIITLISGPQYLDAAVIVYILAIYPFFAFLSYVLYQNMLLQNKTRLIGIIYIFGAFFNIALNILLIPLIGMAGSAIATTASYILLFLAMYLFSKGKKQIVPNYKFLKISRILAAALIMAIPILIINPQTALIKILTIALGMAVYGAMLFLLKAFVKEEGVIIKGFLKKLKLTR